MKRVILISVLSLVAAIFSFSLSAQEAKTKPAIDNERPAVEITTTTNKVHIKNAVVGQKLEVYSIVGLKVEVIVLKSSTSEHTLSIPKGYYILKVGDIVRKVAIK